MDKNKAALEAYRIKLAAFKPDAKNSIEKKFGLLEKHPFRKKFGSEALDINRSWNAERRVPLQFKEEHEEKEGKWRNTSKETCAQKLIKLSIKTHIYF